MKTIVIGIGNACRGDDGVGLIVVRQLQDSGLPGVAYLQCASPDPSLIDLWTGAERLIMVDAVRSPAAPGTLHRFEIHRGPLPAEIQSGLSTHGFGLAATLEMARAVERLPTPTLLFGVASGAFGHGTALSPPVLRGAEGAALAIRRELETSHQSRKRLQTMAP